MQHVSERRSNRERTEVTRRDLLRAARKLFAEKSYAETSTPEIVATAGVTRGALYHHFPDKQALFRAVVEREAADVAGEIERATLDDSQPLSALLAGSAAYFTAMRAPGRARLLLLDGPAVLGRSAIDEIDSRHGNRTLREALVAMMDSGVIQPMPVDPLTALLGAAFDRAALAIADGAPAEDYQATLYALLDGLSRPKATD